MNDSIAPHDLETSQQLHREATDQGGRKPDKVVRLDQFVEIEAEQLRYDTQVISEREMIDNLDHVVPVTVNLHHIFQYFYFHHRLTMETLFISDDFDGHTFPGSMIDC